MKLWSRRYDPYLMIIFPPTRCLEDPPSRIVPALHPAASALIYS